MARTAGFVHHVFEKLWGAGTDTPPLMQVLRSVTRTLMENPGTTFADIPLLFSSDTVRAKMVANLTNSSIVSFWEDFNLKAPRYREEYIESTKNKVMSFLDEPIVRNIVAQPDTTINFATSCIVLILFFLDLFAIIGGICWFWEESCNEVVNGDRGNVRQKLSGLTQRSYLPDTLLPEIKIGNLRSLTRRSVE